MERDIRDELIRQVVRGRSFADVGGLWGAVNEKVSVAHNAGATELTMVDASAPDSEWWSRFEQRMSQLAVTGCRTIVGDITSPSTLADLGEVDVVHCSGVLYHLPNPLQLLTALHTAAARHVVLTTAVTRTSIGRGRRRVTVPESGLLFVPALTSRERETLASYWRERGVEALGITAPASFDVSDFGPWWFLPTARTMRAMAESAGFAVLEQHASWNGDATTLLLASA
jgi:hypothetical protein